MKIRIGFVSNSSSSSFIIVLPREPTCADDVKNMFFSEEQTHYYHPYDDTIWTVDVVAAALWRDIQNTKKNDFENARYQLSYYDEYSSPKSKNYEDYRDYEKACEVYAKYKLDKFYNVRKNKLKIINGEECDDVLYILEYSDNGGGEFGCAFEHGNLFDNVKHIRISNH